MSISRHERPAAARHAAQEDPERDDLVRAGGEKARRGRPHLPRGASASLQDVRDLLRVGHTPFFEEEGARAPRFRRRHFRRGEMIYRKGQAFSTLFVVRLGFLKTILRNIIGDERILSFPMQGDLLGFDGIYYKHYTNDAMALTDGDLIAIPFEELLVPGRRREELTQMIYLAASREIVLERSGLGLSITVQAEARVARFLAMQAKRYSDLGYSSRNFVLPMTRRDLGSYLGLSLETTSRSLSALAGAGIIAVDRRDIRILKPELLGLTHDFPVVLEQSRQRSRDASPDAPTDDAAP